MPAGLSREAAHDLRNILRASRAFGADRARKTAEQMAARLDRIARGEGRGHKRPDIVSEQPILCATVAPFLIFHHADTRRVLRIVDGRRDLPPLFSRPS